jgi:hypothetical protein
VAAGYPDVSSTHDAKSGTLFLNVLNRCERMDIATSIDNPDGCHFGSIDVWELSHPDLKTTHTFGADKKVRPVTRRMPIAVGKSGVTYTFPKHSLTIPRLRLTSLEGCFNRIGIMLDITKDIQSLTTFRRQSGEFMKQLRKSKRRVVPTAEAYQRLLDIAAQANEEEALPQGLEDSRNGSTRPVREFFKEFEARHGRQQDFELTETN